MDKHFRETLDRLQIAPPDVIWQRVEHQLLTQKRKAKRMLFLRYAASVTAIIGLSVSGWFISHRLRNTEYVALQPALSAPTGRQILHSERPESLISQPIQKERVIGKQIKAICLRNDVGGQALDSLSKGSVVDVLESGEIKCSPTIPADTFQAATVASSETVVKHTPSVDYKQAQKYLDSIKWATLHEVGKGPDIIANKWALNGNAAPTYTYRALGSGTDKQLNQQETGTLAYSAGLGLEYKAGRRWRIRSGVYLSRYGNAGSAQATVTNTSNAYVTPKEMRSISVESSVGELNNGVVTTDRSVTDENISALAPMEQVDGTFTQQLDYVEVPLAIRYRVGGKNLGFNILGGIGANVLVANHTNVDLNTAIAPGFVDNNLETNSIRKYNFNSSIGLGIQYMIGKRITLDIEPVFKLFLNSVNQSADKLVYPYSVGVYTGFTYTL